MSTREVCATTRRRSRRQVAALDWSGGPEPILDPLFAFGPADDDIDY